MKRAAWLLLIGIVVGGSAPAEAAESHRAIHSADRHFTSAELRSLLGKTGTPQALPKFLQDLLSDPSRLKATAELVKKLGATSPKGAESKNPNALSPALRERAMALLENDRIRDSVLRLMKDPAIGQQMRELAEQFDDPSTASQVDDPKRAALMREFAERLGSAVRNDRSASGGTSPSRDAERTAENRQRKTSRTRNDRSASGGTSPSRDAERAAENRQRETSPARNGLQRLGATFRPADGTDPQRQSPESRLSSTSRGGSDSTDRSSDPGVLSDVMRRLARRFHNSSDQHADRLEKLVQGLESTGRREPPSSWSVSSWAPSSWAPSDQLRTITDSARSVEEGTRGVRAWGGRTARDVSGMLPSVKSLPALPSLPIPSVSIPRPSIPRLTVPRWNAPSVDNVGSLKGMGLGLLAFVVAAGAVVAVALLAKPKVDRFVVRRSMRMELENEDLPTRQRIRRAFERLAHSAMGLEAEHSHHRRIADVLGAESPEAHEAAERLAGLYEQARYTPPWETIGRDAAQSARAECHKLSHTRHRA